MLCVSVASEQLSCLWFQKWRTYKLSNICFWCCVGRGLSAAYF